MTPRPSDSGAAKAPGQAIIWAMWSLGALFYFQAFFQRVAPSVMVDDLMRDLNLSAGALGNLSALYFWGYGLAQLPTGMMADRWGARRLLTAAAIVCGLGGLLFVSSDTVAAANTGRFVIGFGSGFGFITTLKIVSEWFPASRFSMLGGLTVLIGTLGGLAGQAPLAWAVGEFGWRIPLAGAAVFVLVLGAGVWLVVRDPRNTPGVVTDSDEAPNPLHGMGRVLRQPQTWIITIAGSASLASLFAFGALWGVPYLMEARDFTRTTAAASVSLMLLGWGCGAPLIGWLSDRLDRRKAPFLVTSVVSLLSINLIFYVPSLAPWSVNVLLFVNGACSAGVVVMFALVRDHNDSHAGATAMSIVNMGLILSGAILQPIIGWLLDLNWEGRFETGRRVYSVAAYDGALWVIPVCAALAVLMATLIREKN